MGPLGCAITLVTMNPCSVMSWGQQRLIYSGKYFYLIVVMYLRCFIKWKPKPCYLHSWNTYCFSCYMSYKVVFLFLFLFIYFFNFYCLLQYSTKFEYKGITWGTPMIPLWAAASLHRKPASRRIFCRSYLARGNTRHTLQFFNVQCNGTWL